MLPDQHIAEKSSEFPIQQDAFPSGFKTKKFIFNSFYFQFDRKWISTTFAKDHGRTHGAFG
jgi:hypothetical protein